MPPEAAAPKLALRPRGMQICRAGAGENTGAGRSESIFIVGREGITGSRHHRQTHRQAAMDSKTHADRAGANIRGSRRAAVGGSSPSPAWAGTTGLRRAGTG